MNTISPEHSRLQSQGLVWVVGFVLVAGAARLLLLSSPQQHWLVLWTGCLSLTFGILVWALRAATPPAAVCGAVISFLITLGTAYDLQPGRSALPALAALFLLTFFSTRAGRTKKIISGSAESRRGRDAAQIVANLSAAGLLATHLGDGLIDRVFPQTDLYASSTFLIPVMILATLAEATADTVSSEIGQAFGGTPVLLTTLRRVQAGTDGAISLIGTLAGLFAAMVVIAVGLAAMPILGWRFGLVAYVGGILGFVFDSLLGATLERRGYLGNDLVNFASTLVPTLAVLLVCSLTQKLSTHH